MPLIKPPFGFVGSAADLSFMGILRSLNLTTNLKLCLDAGSRLSYTSGEKWLDMSGNGYDFMLGSETGSPTTGDEPDHVGTPGGLSVNEYFEIVNGDEFFRYDAAKETWMNNISKNNAKFTILVWQRPKTEPSDGGIFCTSRNDGFHGFMYAAQGTKNYITNLSGSHLLSSGSSIFAASSWPVDTWHLTGVSFDEAAGAANTGGFFYRDGAYDPVSGPQDQFDSTYSGSSTDHAEPPNIGLARGGITAFGLLPAGYRFGGLMVWEGTVLTKEQIDTIWLNSRSRFGLMATQAWSPSRKATNVTLSNSDQTWSIPSAEIGVLGLDFVSSGKYYCEFVIDTLGGSCCGVATPSAPLSGTNMFVDANVWCYNCRTAARANNGTNAAYGSALVATNRLMMAVDMTGDKIWWGKNGTWFTNGGVGDPAAGTNAAFTNLPTSVTPFGCNDGTGTTSQVTAKFKAAGWLYSAPSGFSAWPTA